MSTVVCVGYSRAEMGIVRAACAAYSPIFVTNSVGVNSRVVRESALLLVQATSDRCGALDEARHLKQHFPSIPLIVTSCEAALGIAIDALRMRASDFVLLPEETGYLAACILRWAAVVKAAAPERRAVLLTPIDFQSNQNSQNAIETQPALDLIRREFAERLPVDKLAAACKLSGDRFRRQFKVEHGATVREYLKQYRIDRAARLLRETDFTVQEIAYRVGYADPCLFNRLFKRCMGHAPSDWRTIARQQESAAGADPVLPLSTSFR